MKIHWLSGFLLVVLPFVSAQPEPLTANPIPAALLGYSSQNAVLQSQWEGKFMDGISPANIRESMRRLSARPHHVGSPYDKDNAEWILVKFKEWGFDAKIETFNVLFPTPKVRVLEMLQPTHFRARLQEPAIASDPTSAQTAEQLPTYNAYSADGDVTAPDYTAFQDFAGISTLSVEFGDEDDGSQYHSVYDDFHWYSEFVDKDFAYGRALSQTAGTAIMRLADADLIPVDFSPQADAIEKYENDLEKLLKDKQEEFTERNLELQEGVFKATDDPHRRLLPPHAETVPPFINLAPMKNAIALLKRSAERYSLALSSYKSKGSAALPAQSLASINADLLRVPRLFLNQKGLPGRPWFKNQIYAPGAYTGYGAKPVAAVREYMDEKKWLEAEGQVPQVAQVIENAAAGIDRAAEEFESALAHMH